jgi:hypothetical protein
LIAHRTLDAGVDLESDHPGFNDQTYRARRAELAANAIDHRWDQPIPRIDYTKEETDTWGAVWDRMEPLWKKYACKEYLVRLPRVVGCCCCCWLFGLFGVFSDVAAYPSPSFPSPSKAFFEFVKRKLWIQP